MLMWNSMVIHGSLPTTDQRHSRRSFTAHYVPRSHQYQWNVRTEVSRRSIVINQVEVILHRDDSTWWRRVRSAVRSGLPRVYGLAQAMRRAVPGMT